MKKLSIFLFLFFGVSKLFAQSENIEIANRFLADFKAKRFEALKSYFDASVADKITPNLMKDTEAALAKQFGEIKTGTATEIKSGAFQIVSLPMVDQPISIQFTFTTAHQLMGFNFVPKKSLYKDPPYADQSLYTEEKLIVQTGDFKLPAILTKPNGMAKFPIVILVHGSGPGDKDETAGSTKGFRDLALGLAAKGIATLRYDKRTRIYGLKSSPTGEPLTVKEEVIADVSSAIKLAQSLPGVDAKGVYVLGHSLGAMLAPQIASENSSLAGIIMMAAPARSLGATIKDQFTYLIKDPTALKEQLLVADEIVHADTIKDQQKLLMGVAASYYTNLNQYNQVATAKQLKLPILMLQGERDYQVTLKDLNSWKAALTKQKNVTIKSYAKLNHLFTSGEGLLSSPAEYEVPANIPLYVIDDLSNWILKK